MKHRERSEEVGEKYWSKVYDRLERGLGWIFTSLWYSRDGRIS